MIDNLKAGGRAPDFSLPDQNNKWQKLENYKGEWVLVYFYPKDDTPGCTKEACSMRDNLPKFEDLKAKVLGISTDTVESHEKFAKKYKLTFPLLADTKRQVVKDYGVWKNKKLMGREYQGIVRTSFLIDPRGNIAKIYEKVNPEEHAKEVTADLAILTNGK